MKNKKLNKSSWQSLSEYPVLHKLPAWPFTWGIGDYLIRFPSIILFSSTKVFKPIVINKPCVGHNEKQLGKHCWNEIRIFCKLFVETYISITKMVSPKIKSYPSPNGTENLYRKSCIKPSYSFHTKNINSFQDICCVSWHMLKSFYKFVNIQFMYKQADVSPRFYPLQ